MRPTALTSVDPLGPGRFASSRRTTAPAAVRVEGVAGVHRLTLQEARRIAVRAQLLDAVEPIGLVALVEHLGLLQLDPVSAVAPRADLVAWSRLGRGTTQGC